MKNKIDFVETLIIILSPVLVVGTLLLVAVLVLARVKLPLLRRK